MNLLCHFGTDPFDFGGNHLRRRLAQAMHGTERFQNRTFAGGADIRNLIQNRVLDRPQAQRPVVSHGEPVRLVADRLQQFQGRTLLVDHDRLAAPGNENLLVAFGKSDHRKRRTVQLEQRIDRRAELSLAAVHDQQIRQRLFFLQQTVEMA